MLQKAPGSRAGQSFGVLAAPPAAESTHGSQPAANPPRFWGHRVPSAPFLELDVVFGVERRGKAPRGRAWFSGQGLKAVLAVWFALKTCWQPMQPPVCSFLTPHPLGTGGKNPLREQGVIVRGLLG